MRGSTAAAASFAATDAAVAAAAEAETADSHATVAEGAGVGSAARAVGSACPEGRQSERPRRGVDLEGEERGAEPGRITTRLPG